MYICRAEIQEALSSFFILMESNAKKRLEFCPDTVSVNEKIMFQLLKYYFEKSIG